MISKFLSKLKIGENFNTNFNERNYKFEKPLLRAYIRYGYQSTQMQLHHVKIPSHFSSKKTYIFMGQF